MNKRSRGCALIISLLAAAAAFGQDPCERFAPGSEIQEPEDLYSQNGVLTVDLSYQTSVDAAGETHYCFVNSDGAESPTLHVNPGDTLIINLTNLVPEQQGKTNTMPEMAIDSNGVAGCGDTQVDASSVNLHFHGTNTPPVCHQDEVIHTIVNSGHTFQYKVHFPGNEPPGLYWYHPHIHGLSTAAVQGGASGAIIVDGIENVNPAVAGLPQELLIVRDNPAEGGGGSVRLGNKTSPLDIGAPIDLSINYAPITTPLYAPGQLTMPPGEKQFWRVLNASAESVIEIQLQYDTKLQPLQVVALDGVPVGSQQGTGQGTIVTRPSILIPPAGRAEFIMTGPAATVQQAILTNVGVSTGPDGDNEPPRELVKIIPSSNARRSATMRPIPAVSGPPPVERFAGLAEAKPTTTRSLYFSENSKHFFITVTGQQPRPYTMGEPPAITTTQGSVEDWTIENQALENHEFHIHQIHFLLLARNNKRVPDEERQLLDTVNIPYWSGSGPYPNVTVRMDFRGPDVGDFVYHCHILDHEDAGMMAIIRVLPKAVTNRSLPKKERLASTRAN